MPLTISLCCAAINAIMSLCRYFVPLLMPLYRAIVNITMWCLYQYYYVVPLSMSLYVMPLSMLVLVCRVWLRLELCTLPCKPGSAVTTRPLHSPPVYRWTGINLRFWNRLWNNLYSIRYVISPKETTNRSFESFITMKTSKRLNEKTTFNKSARPEEHSVHKSTNGNVATVTKN